MAKSMTLIMLCTLLWGCGLSPSKPMRVQDFRDAQKPKKHLMILLSGRGASFDYFEANRWVDIAEKYTQDYDFIAPYAHYGYYVTDTLVTRLHEDIILPAIKQGYETISLAGISMGGTGSLLYSEEYPAEIDRLYLFSPYVGKGEVHTQIKADGGLAKWHLRMENEHDWNYLLWRRLQEITMDPIQRQKLFLGYGDKDRLKGHDLLAKSLPANHLIRIQGNHDDVTFARLWEGMLQQGLLSR
jgi:pimeloyl-ACP methyl ester carboxylesterase